MIQSKRAEWEQACRKWPDLPPFVLLKLSMTWHGAVLSEQALDRLQEPDYCFGKLEPFGIRFHGRPSGKVMPGAILLRDGTNVYINYGETYTSLTVLILFPARIFTGRSPAAGRPWKQWQRPGPRS